MKMKLAALTAAVCSFALPATAFASTSTTAATGDNNIALLILAIVGIVVGIVLLLVGLKIKRDNDKKNSGK